MEIMALSVIIEDEERTHQTFFLPLQSKHILNFAQHRLPFDLERITTTPTPSVPFIFVAFCFFLF